jgi:hypothetical protein
MRISEQVRFDPVARATRFTHWCDGCRRFTQVAGLTPVYLAEWQPIPERFVVTDVSFGSGNELGPAILVGPELGRRMARGRYKGLELEPISQREPLNRAVERN